MRLLIFLVLSRYGLACKYRIISQIAKYNWMQIAFSDISGIAFSYFKIKLHLIDYLSLLRQVRWFITG